MLAVALVTVHLLAGRFGFGDRIPRSRWLSAAGGVSVAYVFVHLLPEVGEAAAALAERGDPTAFAEHHGYLIALLGFVVFYGLERLARRTTAGPSPGGDSAGIGVFWIHVGSFAAYNAIVGYLLWDRESAACSSFPSRWRSISSSPTTGSGTTTGRRTTDAVDGCCRRRYSSDPVRATCSKRPNSSSPCSCRS